MKIKIKKLHPDAVIPEYSRDGDAGMDITAIHFEFDDKGNAVYKTGISVEIPKGYVGLLFPRSSIANTALNLTNAVGVIDSGYRGEILFKFKPSTGFPKGETVQYRSYKLYSVGDRIGQIIILPYPTIEFEEVEELEISERNSNGFGSTN